MLTSGKGKESCPITHGSLPHLPRGNESASRIMTFFSPNGTIKLLSTGEVSRHDAKIEVASSFTPDQLGYISTTVRYLALLCDGRVVGQEVAEELTPLSQKIVGHFLERDGEEIDHERHNPNTLFKKAMDLGIRDTFTDFARFYPNLLPVLYYLYLKANAGSGTEEAIERGGKLFAEIGWGQLSHDNQKDFRIERNEFADFLSPEPGMPEVEVLCVGKSFAQAIFRHAKRAALELGAFSNRQFPLTENEPTTNFSQYIGSLLKVG